MSDLINLGVIGAGYIAEEHIRVIKKIKELNIYAVASRTHNKCLKLKEKYKITKIYDDYIEMAKDVKIDAILIFVSANEIFEVIKKIISIKKPFFTEKPAGLNLSQSLMLSKLSKKNNSLNMVGYNRRFYITRYFKSF